MHIRGNLLAVLVLGMSFSAHAQLTQEARFSVLGSLIATEGAARIPMPLGKNGVDLFENGLVDRAKLQKELMSNGQAITPGKIVSITAIEFGDKSLEFELNGGGTKKKGILSRIQVGVGGASSQTTAQTEAQAIGSKITLKFGQKIPPTLSVEQIKDLLNPVLDFTKQSTAKAGIDALPPEFRDAVVAKEARIGMDGNTVMLALGLPNKRIRNPKNEKGIEQEDWVYIGKGRRQTFVTFEEDVVVEIREYR